MLLCAQEVIFKISVFLKSSNMMYDFKATLAHCCHKPNKLTQTLANLETAAQTHFMCTGELSAALPELLSDLSPVWVLYQWTLNQEHSSQAADVWSTEGSNLFARRQLGFLVTIGRQISPDEIGESSTCSQVSVVTSVSHSDVSVQVFLHLDQ